MQVTHSLLHSNALIMLQSLTMFRWQLAYNLLHATHSSTQFITWHSDRGCVITFHFSAWRNREVFENYFSHQRECITRFHFSAWLNREVFENHFSQQHREDVSSHFTSLLDLIVKHLCKVCCPHSLHSHFGHEIPSIVYLCVMLEKCHLWLISSVFWKNNEDRIETWQRFLASFCVDHFPVTVLCCFSIHGSDLGDMGMKILGLALSKHPGIVSLDVGDCKLSDMSIDVLYSLLLPLGNKSGNELPSCVAFCSF